jgi:glycosyltransferase involved in cell wall biosynthesis
MRENTPRAASLCMIVKNEERFLEDCLKSARALVEQIVIVDTGSTDGTIHIAEKYHAEIYHFEWRDDYAAARNFALEKATAYWIIHLDADERIAAESLYHIERLLKTSTDDAFTLNVRNWHPKEDMIQYLDSPQIRIFRNDKKYRYKNRIHEQIAYSIEKNKGVIFSTNDVIHHYGYRFANREKMKKNCELLRLAVQKEAENTYLTYKLGESYKAIGEMEKAKDAFLKAESEINGILDTENKENLFVRLSQIFLQEDNYSQSARYAKKALQLNFENPIALYILTIDEVYMNLISAAEKNISKLRSIQKNQFISDELIKKLQFVIDQIKGLG